MQLTEFAKPRFVRSEPNHFVRDCEKETAFELRTSSTSPVLKITTPQHEKACA